MAGLNIILGKSGEDRACRALKKNGYMIVKRNYKNPFGEVDIIAEKGDILAFIEVKTRSSDIYGQPNEAVTSKRQEKYRQAVKYYFLNREIDRVVRFDIIEVFASNVNHIENAF